MEGGYNFSPQTADGYLAKTDKYKGMQFLVKGVNDVLLRAGPDEGTWAAFRCGGPPYPRVQKR